MTTEDYTNNYNELTKGREVSYTGAENFRISKDLLMKCGYHDMMSVLDYGCGWGSLLTVINPKEYIGVDINSVVLEEAVKRFPDRTFEICKIGEVQVEPVDMIIAHSVFTHVPEEIVDICLGDIKRNLKKDGFVIIDIDRNGQNNGIYSSYQEERWLEILNLNELNGELIGEKIRNERMTHSYYKIIWQ